MSIFFGISGIALPPIGSGVRRLIDFTEIRSVLPQLPDENMLRDAAAYGVMSVRLEIAGRNHFNKKLFERDSWALFLQQYMNVLKTRDGYLMLALSQSDIYSRELLEYFAAITDSLYPLRLLLDAPHRSWHREEVLRELYAAAIPIVLQDAPLLPGITHSQGDDHKQKISYLRLRGRNARDWFSADLKISNHYEYLRSEEQEIAKRILRLHDESDKVLVVSTVLPPESSVRLITGLERDFDSVIARSRAATTTQSPQVYLSF
jgi:uncharacterized protein YecE (DUF72 family)